MCSKVILCMLQLSQGQMEGILRSLYVIGMTLYCVVNVWVFKVQFVLIS